MKDLKDYRLLKHNTFGIDVSCRRFLEYASVDEAMELTASLTEEDAPLLIIGEGSNLLLKGDYPGTVIHSAVHGIEVQPTTDGYWLLRCGSGELFDDVVAYAYGVEAKDFIVEVEALEIVTGRIVKFTNTECEYGYRQSKFKHEWKERFLMTHVTYRLSSTFNPKLSYGNICSKLAEKHIKDPTAEELRNVIIEIRQEKLPDPKIIGNAGSFFMNPIVDEAKYKELSVVYPQMPFYRTSENAYKIPAGWMIEQCGWKGKTLGKAGVYEKQALVLVNLGGATGEEIIALYHAVQHDVKARFGIAINPEVNIR